MKRIAIILVATFSVTGAALAHSGGLNSEGCHNNRKTGDYHYHRAQTIAPTMPSSTQDDDVYYPNCTAARAAGVAPILIGEPGYRPKLDRDGDGIACE
jgi:hypothetical protein